MGCMLLPRKALSAEQLRRLAVLMVSDGDPPDEVADLLDVSERSVWRWLSRWRRRGRLGDVGVATGRWTARRVAAVIERELGVHRNRRYLNHRLAVRDATPQVPPRVPRERDDDRIAAWVAHAWPGIKKRSPTAARPSFSRTRAAFCCSRWCAAPWRRAAAPRRCCTARAIGTRCRSRRR